MTEFIMSPKFVTKKLNFDHCCLDIDLLVHKLENFSILMNPNICNISVHHITVAWYHLCVLQFLIVLRKQVMKFGSQF